MTKRIFINLYEHFTSDTNTQKQWDQADRRHR